MEKTIQILALTNNLILISEIQEIAADFGEPNCKLINPYVVKSNKTLERFLSAYTHQNTFMMSSENILTIVDPIEEILEQYFEIIGE